MAVHGDAAPLALPRGGAAARAPHTRRAHGLRSAQGEARDDQGEGAGQPVGREEQEALAGAVREGQCGPLAARQERDQTGRCRIIYIYILMGNHSM